MISTFHRLPLLAVALTFAVAGCSEPPTSTSAPEASASKSEPAVAEAPADAPTEAASQENATETQEEPTPKSAAEAYEIATVKAQGQYDMAVEKCGNLRSQRGKDKCQEAATAALERSVAAAEAALNEAEDAGTDGAEPVAPPVAEGEQPPKD